PATRLLLPPFPTRRSSDLRRARFGCRSPDGGDQRIARGEILAGSHPYLSAELGRRVAYRLLDLRRAEVARGRIDEVADEAGRLGDRKSTRLNSSHDQISYA